MKMDGEEAPVSEMKTKFIILKMCDYLFLFSKYPVKKNELYVPFGPLKWEGDVLLQRI